MFRPIKALLSRSNEGRWTKECYNALKTISEVLACRLSLSVARPGGPFYLYVALDDAGGGCILCQEDAGLHVPVAILG